MLFFTAQELVLIIFGDQWQPSVPVFRILALSVGIQIVMSTSGSIFQAANATRMLFFCGVFSAVLNVAAICTGIFAFGTTEAVAWCICASFAVNFVQCYHALFCLTLRTGWAPFWRQFPLAPAAHGTRRPAPGSSRMASAADACSCVAHAQGDGGTRRMAALCAPQRRIRPERARTTAPRPQKPITHMKGLFVVFHGFSAHSGISKKIFAQCDALRRNGADIELCHIEIAPDGTQRRMVGGQCDPHVRQGLRAKLAKRVSLGDITRYIRHEGWSSSTSATTTTPARC